LYSHPPPLVRYAAARPPRAIVSVRRYASAPPRPQITADDQAILLHKPDPTELKKLDMDLELLDPSEAKLIITERAAEHLRRVTEKEHNPDLALRISVESGGCHGYQYKMGITSASEPDDYIFARTTPQPSRVVVDAISLNLLKGSTVDYTTELIGSSFRIMDNPQAKGNGCGCGVSWEAKI